MKNKKYNTNNTGIGVLGILLIIFVVLKLVGVITWSWWIVLAPLWAELSLFVIVIFVILRLDR